MNHHHQQQLIAYAITALIVGVVLFFRIRRMRGTRKLNLNQLWIIPAIYGALALFVFATSPPHGTGWLLAVVALIAGAALGWQRGRSMRIAVDPESGGLNQSASPLTFLFLIGLIVIKVGLQTFAKTEGAAWNLDAVLITDCFVMLGLGLFTVQRIEMYLRGRRLLEGARTA
jgi:membrane protein CcdC involved in cytochrome C biogenesis